MAVEQALYRDGARVRDATTTAQIVAGRSDRSLAWIDLDGSDDRTLDEVARLLALPHLAVEDTRHAHQRAKLERYDDTFFIVLRPARYIDATETVEFGELHMFAGRSFVVTVAHGAAADVASVRRSLEAHSDILRRGPLAVVHAILDLVVDDYAPVAAGIENDLDEIEDQVFGQSGDVSKRTYELTREVIAFQRALKPLAAMVESLMTEPGVTEDESHYLRDVHDHTLRIEEQIDGFRHLLDHILHVNLTAETKALSELSHRQSEEVKRISAWAAILFAPTLVGTVYGMNFRHMPELDWRYGYPFAMALMVGVACVLYLIFRRRRWI